MFIGPRARYSRTERYPFDPGRYRTAEWTGFPRRSAAPITGRRGYMTESHSPRTAVIGPGRLGTTLAAALREAGREVVGPLGRGESAAADLAILCVPDGEIAAAAAAPARVAPTRRPTSGAPP